jgi:23S rRNA (cytidine1920-2'-O)/16S rRNA (cytidine1409-2'-O)-methyltransferase
MTDARRRLDEEMVARGLAATRSRARDLIIRGLVRVAGTVAGKPAYAVRENDAIDLIEGAGVHVSRGAEKLIAALDAFGFDPSSRIALDVGASTGGFTEVLLARGAAKVYAVDVGHSQLHPRLAADARVVSLEGLDARKLDRACIPEAPGAIVADVSFISLTLALPAALSLAAPGCWLATLIKPQFEAGRDAVGKGGIVRDDAKREAAVAKVRDWLAAQSGWRVSGVVASPIEGGSGNREYLIGAVHE